MWDVLTGLLGHIITAIFSAISVPKQKSPYAMQYEELRYDVAMLLSKNARFYFNPVEMTKIRATDECADYAKASEETKILGAKLAAFSEILPDKVKDLHIDRIQIYQASRYLYGLSNVFQLPYNITERYNYGEYVDIHIQQARKYETELRNILKLHIPGEAKWNSKHIKRM